MSASESTPSCTDGLVSVVVPMYNVEKTLDACLASVEAQTYGSLEVICVNDGSTDGSCEVARAHAASDPRIRVIDKPNEGYGASCNRGIDAARGTWVAIVEPDDELEPRAFEELLACADAFGGAGAVDVVKAAYWRVFPPAEPGGLAERVSCPYRGRVRPRRQPFGVEETPELLLHHPSIWAALYRRGYLAERKIRFVEAPGSGWTDNPFMAATLLLTRRIAYTDTPVYRYYERDLGEAETFAARSPLVPLTRWNEMMDVAATARVSDARVLEALAVRGVNYACITRDAGALDDPQVKALAVESMERLDAKAVLGSRLISPAGKRLFCELRGLKAPSGGRLGWYLHLAGEAVYRVRTNGIGFALRTAKARKDR